VTCPLKYLLRPLIKICGLPTLLIHESDHVGLFWVDYLGGLCWVMLGDRYLGDRASSMTSLLGLVPEAQHGPGASVTCSPAHPPSAVRCASLRHCAPFRYGPLCSPLSLFPLPFRSCLLSSSVCPVLVGCECGAGIAVLVVVVALSN